MDVDIVNALLVMRTLGLPREKIAEMLSLPPETLFCLVKIIQDSQSCFLELLRCKLSSDSASSESELLGIKNDEMEEVKRRSLDPTTPVCDVCGPSKRESFGGVVLEEDDGTFTITCQDCYDTFTNKPVGRKQVDTWFKRIALASGIGTNSDNVYEWLDKKRVFEDNVRDFLVRQGDRRKTFFSNETGRFMPSAGDSYMDYCLGCMDQFPQQKLISCTHCKKARYCSSACMDADRKRHEGGCNAYMNSVKTQELYVLPDACDCCGEVPALGSLMTCGRCKNALYCSKKCQVKMWKTHKKDCK